MNEQATAEASKEQQAMGEDDFLNDYAGQGTEDLKGGTPFLSICNKLTEDGMAQGKLLGHWWHSGLNKSFGAVVEVIPTGWKPVWVEKSEDGRTVSYHPENGCNLLETGSGTTYKCTNKDTGNKVERTICIVVLLPADENSAAILIPGVSSMEAVRSWRKMLNFNRLSSGAKAPIFSHVWKLTTAKKVNGKNTFYVIDKVERGMQITKEYLLTEINPILGLIAGNPHNLLPSTNNPKSSEDDIFVSERDDDLA